MSAVEARFSGLVVPLLTPISDAEEVDIPALERHIEHVLSARCDAIFILGSNGEGAMLRPAVCLQMARETIRIVAGRVPVMAGVLDVSTLRILEGVDALAGLGIAGYVATSPLYFDGFTEGDLLRHFEVIATHCDAPMMLYNIPQYTSSPLTESLVRRCAEVPNISGIKDSSGTWAPFQNLVLDRPAEHFAVLQGYQQASVTSLFIGADGLVPGLSNLKPKLVAALIDSASEGKWAEALSYQSEVDHYLGVRGRAIIHANKVIANSLGLMSDNVTSPLSRLTPSEADELVRQFAAAERESSLRA